MYMKLKDGKSKALTLSYDDGVVQDIRLIEILNKYGIKATFNINTGRYLPEEATREKFYGRMKLSEAKKLNIIVTVKVIFYFDIIILLFNEIMIYYFLYIGNRIFF